jgi:hypothetical protein
VLNFKNDGDMNLALINSLLGQVSSLNRMQEKLALLSGENFNVFRILGLETREVRMHSAFLGELLNPDGSHGLRDTFLKLFTQAVGFKEFETNTARLVVEYDIGRISADYLQGGRIDIYLESAGQYIFIENKIYASDQHNQLGRYYAYRPGARLLYLTLNGSVPTKEGAGILTSEQYQCLSYHTHILKWLEECRQAAAAYPLVRETIVQYQHLINYLTGRVSNDFTRMEMQQLVQRSEDNFVSAFALGQAFIESQNTFIAELVEKFEEAWYIRFSENLSPLPEYAIYFRLHENSYGFRAVKNGEEVAASQEEALKPLIGLALAISKLKPDSDWIAWRWMENRYFNNIQPAELYQAATNKAAREHLFEDRLREGSFYFDKFKELVAASTY